MTSSGFKRLSANAEQLSRYAVLILDTFHRFRVRDTDHQVGEVTISSARVEDELLSLLHATLVVQDRATVAKTRAQSHWGSVGLIRVLPRRHVDPLQPNWHDIPSAQLCEQVQDY